MKSTGFVAACLLGILALTIVMSATAQEKRPASEKFGALAYMPSGPGPALLGPDTRVNVDLYFNGYTTDAEASSFAGSLLEGGSEALLKALQKEKAIGKISLVGRTSFYDLKLIRSYRTEGGRRIYAVGDRPMGFLEVYASGRSRDYPFGILQLDLKTNRKGKEEGTGALIYAAKIKVMDGNSIEVENFGLEPIRLLGVRRL